MNHRDAASTVAGYLFIAAAGAVYGWLVGKVLSRFPGWG